MYWFVTLAIMTYLFTIYLMPKLISMIRPRLTALNYRNQDIPVAIGLVIPLTSVPFTITAVILGLVELRAGIVAVITILSFGLLGLIDDTLGSREARGFHGHLRALVQGQITTGMLKAGFGGIIALLVAMINAHGSFVVILDALIIALCANFSNLLDVRPGRAGKFFVLAAAIISICGYGTIPLLLTVVTVIGYLPWDLRCEVMMGDVGSNVLGALVGLTLTNLTVGLKLLLLLLLVVIHYYAERHSISEVIERVPVLNYLDQLGRKQV